LDQIVRNPDTFGHQQPNGRPAKPCNETKDGFGNTPRRKRNEEPNDEARVNRRPEMITHEAHL
jgi:hypothetical protein